MKKDRRAQEKGEKFKKELREEEERNIEEKLSIEKEEKERVSDEGLTPPKDGGTCLRRLSMFRKEVH